MVQDVTLDTNKATLFANLKHWKLSLTQELKISLCVLQSD